MDYTIVDKLEIPHLRRNGSRGFWRPFVMGLPVGKAAKIPCQTQEQAQRLAVNMMSALRQCRGFDLKPHYRTDPDGDYWNLYIWKEDGDGD